MTTSPQLSDLQIAIMRVLWSNGEATVTQVHEALAADRGLAPTTIATVLTRLEKRDLVSHRTEGRQFVYKANVTEEEVRDSMVAEVTDLLFAGDVAAMVSHLLGGSEVSPADLARVKSLIEARERQEGSSHAD